MKPFFLITILAVLSGCNTRLPTRLNPACEFFSDAGLDTLSILVEAARDLGATQADVILGFDLDRLCTEALQTAV